MVLLSEEKEGGFTMLTKIVFDEERKLLVDEDKLEFKGTRVSKVVAETTSSCMVREGAELAAIFNLEELGKKQYNADAYELVALTSRDESGRGEYDMPSYGATAQGIFYKRT